jgi:hypothetical protein
VPEKNLDQIVFWDKLKQAIIPCLVFIVFTVVWIAFSLNIPVSNEEVFGKVINTIGPIDYESPTAGAVLIELDGGRVISIALAPTVSLPNIGQRVTVVRYIKRFFGDSFGLSIKKGAEPFGPAP